MLPHYLVKYLVPEIVMFTIRVKQSGMKDSLSCNIQSFVNSRWKSNVWRCKHYLINWQKHFHTVHTAQSTEWSIRPYTHQRHRRHRKLLLPAITNQNPPSCLQKFVKIWLLIISLHLKCVATLSCDLSLITTLVREYRLCRWETVQGQKSRIKSHTSILKIQLPQRV